MKQKFRVSSQDEIVTERIVETELPDTFVPANGHTVQEYLREQAREKGEAARKDMFKNMDIKNIDHIETKIEPLSGNDE